MANTLYFPAVMDQENNSEQQFVHFSIVRPETSLRLIQFGVHKTPSDYGYGPSAREHNLLHFVFSGRGEVTVAGKHFAVKENEMFFIPRGCVSYYQADSEEPWAYAWVGFEGVAGDVALGMADLTADTPVASIPDAAKIREIVARMSDGMFEPAGYYTLMSGLFEIMEVLTHVQGRMPDVTGIPAETVRKPSATQLNTVITRIEREYTTDLSVQMLADDVGLTRSYLSEIFKRSTGMSIKEYIIRLRMDKARMMLTERNLPVKTIAACVGYDDPLYFSRIFKKYTGKTPLEYRSKNERT